MSAITGSVNRSSSGLDRFSVYCMKSIFLHLHSVDDNLNFHHVLVLAHKFLARLQVCETCREISRYFCGTASVFGSLKVAVDLSSATEGIFFMCERTVQRQRFESVYLFKGQSCRLCSISRKKTLNRSIIQIGLFDAVQH